MSLNQVDRAKDLKNPETRFQLDATLDLMAQNIRRLEARLKPAARQYDLLLGRFKTAEEEAVAVPYRRTLVGFARQTTGANLRVAIPANTLTQEGQVLVAEFMTFTGTALALTVGLNFSGTSLFSQGGTAANQSVYWWVVLGYVGPAAAWFSHYRFAATAMGASQTEQVTIPPWGQDNYLESTNVGGTAPESRVVRVSRITYPRAE